MTTIRVTHLSFSTGGGAGEIAMRLVKSQPQGISQRMLHLTKGDVTAVKFRHPLLFLSAVFDFLVVRKSQQVQLFSLFRRTPSRTMKKLIKEQPDILHIHWYPGMLTTDDIAQIRSIGTKIVVTLHDMYPMTGGCHFSQGCKKFENDCGECPQVKSLFRRPVMYELDKKSSIFREIDDLVVTSPAAWMCEEASRSKAFANSRIIHVPNPIDLGVFTPVGEPTKRLSRKNFGISDDAFVIGFCASNIWDPRKNLEELITSFGVLQRELKDQREIVLLVIGSGKPTQSHLTDGVIFSGRLSNQNALIRAYASLDVFCSLSAEETFPNTIHECAALGIPSVLSRIPGHLHAEHRFGLFVDDHRTFSEVLSSLIFDDELRGSLSYAAIEYTRTLDLHTVSDQYRSIYQMLCGDGLG